MASVLLWLLVALRNDADPFGMLLGFAPRWWAVLPWLVLLPLALFAGRRTIVVALLGAAAAVLGLAQYNVPFARLRSGAYSAASAARGDIRVVTYNTDLRTGIARRLRQDIAAWDADVILLQDCKTVVYDSLRAVFPRAAQLDRFCVASRWPLLDAADAASLAKGRDARLRPWLDAFRVRIRTPWGVLPVYTVHLPSPRDALSEARWPDPARIGRTLWPALHASLDKRSDASAAVSSVVSRNDRAFIVAGDFNLPYGSAILRRDWGDLRNAFSQSAWGFGYTMQAGIFPVRIDHVLVPEALVPIKATVLRGYDSEHQPVVVDLQWRR